MAFQEVNLSDYIPDLLELLYIVPAILIAFTLHEYAHAYTSYILGDPTPKLEGRLSLNPFVHLDFLGTLMLIIFKFGWAKPVMINPLYYKKPKRDTGLVAFAGPLMNFILALISLFIVALIYKVFHGEIASGIHAVYKFFYIFAMINIGLGVFNMIPIPPLDGSKVLGAFLPMNMFRAFMMIEPYGMAILLLLVFTDLLSPPLRFLINAVSDSFELLIGWLLYF